MKCFGCLRQGHISRNCEARLNCGRTGAVKDCGMLSVLSVKVKSVKGDYVVQTYMFLNPGSTWICCSEKLMHHLNLLLNKTIIIRYY